MDPELFRSTLTRQLDNHASKWQPQVAVHAPDLGIEYQYGDTDRPYHSASTGKLVTAALIMQLVQRRELALDTPVVSVLDPAEVRGIFADGQLGKVTIEQLLEHTSGANDYFLGRANGPTIYEQAVQDLGKRWTPADLLAHARERQKPVANPGKRFFYSDTGFIVLGRILEEKTGLEFHNLVHERIFDPLGMESAFMPGLSGSRRGVDKLAPLYLGATRVDTANALTIDWAGGGLAATPADYLTMLKALRTGVLFDKERWDWMVKPRHRYRWGLHYGAGNMTVKFEGLMPWLRGRPRLHGHLGVTSAHLWYDPVHRADIAINYGSTKAMRPSFVALIAVVETLRKLSKEGGCARA